MLDEFVGLAETQLTGYGGEDEAKVEQWLRRVTGEDRQEVRTKLTDATRQLVREHFPRIKALAQAALRKVADVKWEDDKWPVLILIEGEELRALLTTR